MNPLCITARVQDQAESLKLKSTSAVRKYQYISALNIRNG